MIQELGKDDIAPFPNLVMQNRPFRTPIVALFVHLGVTIIFICAPPAGEAFDFVVKLSSYPNTVLLTATTIALIKLRLAKDMENRPFSVPRAIVGFYLAGSVVLLLSFSPVCMAVLIVTMRATVSNRHAIRPPTS